MNKINSIASSLKDLRHKKKVVKKAIHQTKKNFFHLIVAVGIQNCIKELIIITNQKSFRIGNR